MPIKWNCGNRLHRRNGSQSQFQITSQNQLSLSRQAQTDANSNIALRGLIDPSSDRTLAPAYKVLSDSIFKQNRYEKGESYYQRMIMIDIDALGPSHPSVTNDLNGLAQLYIAHEAIQGSTAALDTRSFNLRSNLWHQQFVDGQHTCFACLCRTAVGQLR